MKFLPAVLFASSVVFAQQPPQPAQPPRPPMERGLRPPQGGKWWDNPEIVKRVGISTEQKKKMDDVFLQSRIRLVDLRASLEKDELALEGLMQGTQLDDAKILPVIDRIAQDRAELEKADARMLLGIRHVLTPEQWTILDQRDERGPRGPNPPPPPHE
jgi:Spy/CpxP family protein refolding chaperone